MLQIGVIGHLIDEFQCKAFDENHPYFFAITAMMQYGRPLYLGPSNGLIM
jgi:hypothetical protein